MRDFLFEIQTEELPPKALKKLIDSLHQEITTRVLNAKFTFSKSEIFATPRRLGILLHDLSEKQPNSTIEKRGPALSQAYQDGVPTKACEGFARSLNITPKELTTIKTADGEWVGYKQTIKGKTVIDVIPDIIQESLNALPIPKRMRWSDGNIAFIRPVHSIILLYGNKVIPAEILGIKSGRKTKGHRFLSKGWVNITTPAMYEKILEKKFVIANFDKRKNKIMLAATKLGQKKGEVLLPPALLDEVTGLVEWPVAMMGIFDEKFLQVPASALIAAMQDHQRYFPCVDKKGKLQPHFIFISNIQSKKPKMVVSGNERVLRARLSDAAFFFETDKHIKLIDRTLLLKNVLFQNKLGTLHDKSERVSELSFQIATMLGESGIKTKRAAQLVKADLTTQLVSEFPELQGIAGYHYALSEGLPSETAIAIKEHYHPRFAGDVLPASMMGAIIAIADRLDTLVGIFGINLIPTGDKDPFGLRRGAIGVLRILIEKKLNLDLYELVRLAENGYRQKLENKNVAKDVTQFMLDRLKQRYQDQHISPAIFISVASLNVTHPLDIEKRIQAVLQFKQLPDSDALAEANKRVSNILSKYKENISALDINPLLFENDAERNLYESLNVASETVNKLSKITDYTNILKNLAALRESVDIFFDKVLVMTEDKSIRENRLLLLKKLRELFLHVADVALLQ